MSAPLNPATLNSMCESAYIVAQGLPLHFDDFYFLQLKGGFRYIEVYEISRWIDYDSDYYSVQAAKGGAIRYYQKIAVPQFYKDCISNSVQFYDWCRYETFSRSFRRTFVDYPIFFGDKNITTHIFRYNVVKKLYADGWTVPEISSYIGEVEDINTQGYIDAQLYIN